MRSRGANFFNSTWLARIAASSSSRSANNGTFFNDSGWHDMADLAKVEIRISETGKDSIKRRGMTTRGDPLSGLIEAGECGGPIRRNFSGCDGPLREISFAHVSGQGLHDLAVRDLTDEIV